VSTSQPDRGRGLLSFRERTGRQPDIAAKVLLKSSAPGARRPSLAKEDATADSKPSTSIKEEVSLLFLFLLTRTGYHSFNED